MHTTIQISEHTLQLLKQLKEKMKVSSYDQAIHTITAEKMLPQKSLAGTLKKYVGKNLSKKEILEGLRDKNDRF